MASVKWLAGGSNPVSLITTALNSLTTTGTATSGALDNTSNLYMYVDLQLLITYGTNPTAGSVIECYISRSVDGGTNYEVAAAPAGIVGAFVLAATTSAQYCVIPGVLVPPGFYKIHLVAKTTGQTAAASGNTVTGLYYNEQVV
jgi:hypothetical protein